MSFLKDLVERFKRHLYSAAVFAFLLILLFVSDLLQVSATFQHILLTLTAVMFIHLLDRLYLIKDTNEALDKLFGAVRTDTKAQTDSLNQKSQELLETSKKLINEQTDSLTQKSQQLLESSSELISSVRTGITAQMDQLIGGVRTDIKGQTDSLIHTSKSLEAMDRCGLIRVYPTRIEASEDMRKDITNPANSKMMLIGISLNDFVQGIDHTLREAWETIQAYILGTKRIDDPKQGLDIRILIIDPKCLGAKLRSKAESESVSALAFRLETDVRAAAEALHRLEAEAAKNSSTTGVKFECRLYRLPPIMFLCWIDSICYAQQYHFWSKRDNRTPIPVFKYRRLDASAYPYHKEMENHFEWIWKNASIKVSDYLETEVVGTDEGINQCGVVNIYTNHEGAAKERIIYLLKNAQNKVSIQGISLHSFFTQGKLLTAILPLIEAAKVEVEVLLLDPESEQAKYRSYREKLFGSAKLSFDDYLKLGVHEKFKLYRETNETIEYLTTKVRDIARQKGSNWVPKLKVGKYSSAPACFMLRVDDRVLVEQYHYGKIVRQEEAILGKEMPLFEYDENPSPLYKDESDPLRNPFGLLVNHFEYALAQATIVDLTGQDQENTSSPAH